jgi:NitT/TauT family transport system permease protein
VGAAVLFEGAGGGSILRGVHRAANTMSASGENVIQLAPMNVVAQPRRSLRALGAMCGLSVASLLAIAVHAWAAKKQTASESQYSTFLWIVFGTGVVLPFLQPFSKRLRAWMEETGPIIAAAVVALAVWEFVTSGMRWLPMPYFPGPAIVLRSVIEDREILFKSTAASLGRLLAGYLIGATIAVITGVCIGWFRSARYWGMPLLKLIGPVPATAWIPLAMVMSRSPEQTPIGLVAIAVWFPVTMLTVSGIANVRASYLDVARTLGAGQKYLIFRVAIPAAMPNIFIGLFMGLGASFLTLIVAEQVGVKQGLGWYIQWAQGWAEYGKVYGALIIMAAFFSTIMTALFKVRDRVLVWQKGMIKW